MPASLGAGLTPPHAPTDTLCSLGSSDLHRAVAPKPTSPAQLSHLNATPRCHFTQDVSSWTTQTHTWSTPHSASCTTHHNACGHAAQAWNVGFPPSPKSTATSWLSNLSPVSILSSLLLPRQSPNGSTSRTSEGSGLKLGFKLPSPRDTENPLRVSPPEILIHLAWRMDLHCGPSLTPAKACTRTDEPRLGLPDTSLPDRLPQPSPHKWLQPRFASSAKGIPRCRT